MEKNQEPEPLEKKSGVGAVQKLALMARPSREELFILRLPLLYELKRHMFKVRVV